MDEAHRARRTRIRTSILVGGVVTAVVAGALAGAWAVGRGDARRGRTATVGRDYGHGRIAFASRGGEARYRVHVINSDGTNEKRLTSGFGEQGFPAWSPDGTRIAYVQDPDPGGPPNHDTDVYVMNSDGSGSVRLVSTRAAEGDPAWSPDGTRIAYFTQAPTGQAHIAVTSVDGGGQTDLSEPRAGCNDRDPAWSPDGLRIAFTRRCGDEPSRLYLMDARGDGLVALTDVGRTPDWSPDGSRILYTGAGPLGPSVFVINVDGTGNRRLSDGAASGDPEWSRDGRKIVFTRGDGLTLNLYTMNADGSGLARLTRNPFNEVTASW